MGKLWMVVDKLKFNKSTKNSVFLISLIALCLLAGAVLWAIVGKAFLPEIEWMFCFMGYPAIFIGLFGGILYLYGHSFS